MSIPLTRKHIPASLLKPGDVTVTITNNVPQNPCNGPECGDSTPPARCFMAHDGGMSIGEYIRAVVLGRNK